MVLVCWAVILLAIKMLLPKLQDLRLSIRRGVVPMTTFATMHAEYCFRTSKGTFADGGIG